MPKGEHLEAINALSPPELPPGVRSLFQGFSVRPHKWETVSFKRPNYGIGLLIKGIAPNYLSIFISWPSFNYGFSEKLITP